MLHKDTTNYYSNLFSWNTISANRLVSLHELIPEIRSNIEITNTTNYSVLCKFCPSLVKFNWIFFESWSYKLNTSPLVLGECAANAAYAISDNKVKGINLPKSAPESTVTGIYKI